jgi:hypothetical protein
LSCGTDGDPPAEDPEEEVIIQYEEDKFVDDERYQDEDMFEIPNADAATPVQAETHSSAGSTAVDMDGKKSRHSAGIDASCNAYELRMIPGRPDISQYMKTMAEIAAGRPVAVLVCGPATLQLVEDTKKAAAHYPNFGFHCASFQF